MAKPQRVKRLPWELPVWRAQEAEEVPETWFLLRQLLMYLLERVQTLPGPLPLEVEQQILEGVPSGAAQAVHKQESDVAHLRAVGETNLRPVAVGAQTVRLVSQARRRRPQLPPVYRSRRTLAV